MSKRRALLVNLDFKDFVYSALWGRAILDGCARRNFAVDMVGVSPFAGRDLAGELGVARSALDLRIDGTVVYLGEPDEARSRSVIGQLLDRQHYDLLILNCEASLFIHLMIDREQDLVGTRWLVYDRHLHTDLQAHAQDERLRNRMIGSGMQLFTIRRSPQAIATRASRRARRTSRDRSNSWGSRHRVSICNCGRSTRRSLRRSRPARPQTAS